MNFHSVAQYTRHGRCVCCPRSVRMPRPKLDLGNLKDLPPQSPLAGERDSRTLRTVIKNICIELSNVPTDQLQVVFDAVTQNVTRLRTPSSGSSASATRTQPKRESKKRNSLPMFTAFTSPSTSTNNAFETPKRRKTENSSRQQGPSSEPADKKVQPDHEDVSDDNERSSGEFILLLLETLKSEGGGSATTLKSIHDGP